MYSFQWRTVYFVSCTAIQLINTKMCMDIESNVFISVANCLLCELQSHTVNKHQNNTWVNTKSTYFISLLTKYKKPINNDRKGIPHTSTLHLTPFYLFTFWSNQWRHFFSKSSNHYAGTWEVISNSSDIHWYWTSSEIFPWMRPANERRRYIVTSLIGLGHTLNDPWSLFTAIMQVQRTKSIIHIWL